MLVILTSMSLMMINLKNTLMMPMILMMMMLMMSLSQQQMMLSFMNMDQISTILTLLTLMTSLLVMMASQQKTSMFKFIMTINLTLILAFISSSMILFYIMFELSIIPTFMLIMNQGKQPERLKASMFLLMYTILASIPLLMMISHIFPLNNMINMTLNFNLPMPLLFILAFLVKMPMFSFHLWLPKAHVEAPMEGSMMLAAILLKLGSYGLMRMMPMMKKFSKMSSPLMMSISIMACLITPMICNRQKDMKAMIAYSSIAHMAMIILSLFSSSSLGITAALMMTISHALTSSALFMLTTLSYSKFNSRNIHLLKGFTNFSPNMSMWWFLFLAANIGTPPFASLMSEIFSLTSIMTWSLMTIIFMMMAMMLMASFSIYMFTQINHNSPSTNKNNPNMYLSMKLSLIIHMLPMIMIMINPTTVTF